MVENSAVQSAGEKAEMMGVYRAAERADPTAEPRAGPKDTRPAEKKVAQRGNRMAATLADQTDAWWAA